MTCGQSLYSVALVICCGWGRVFMSQFWILSSLLISSGLAYVWPADWLNPFTASAPWLGVLIAVTMFAVGCLLSYDELASVGRRWPAVILGTVLQYSSMPALAYGIGQAFQFEPGTMAGVILVGCVPGAMASNVLTLMAAGNTSYSVCLTTLATLLSPDCVPLALWLTLETRQDISFVATGLTLLWQVVLPVVGGFALCRISAGANRVANRTAPIVANAAIVWVIAAVVAINRHRIQDVTSSIVIALLLINIPGYLAGYIGGFLFRLDDPMRRALTLEIGMQNCGLGTTLALALFPGTAAAIPTALYTFGCMLTGTLLAAMWSRRLPLA